MSDPTPTLRLEATSAIPVARREVEVVERKGLGHPDTICDSVAEAVSRALCREYLALAGGVLHHNVDKALLIAGVSAPRPGGGRVMEPMRLILGGRATERWEGHHVPVAELAVETARSWFGEHLRYVDPARHLEVESALRPGSAQLVDVYARAAAVANDTSVGVGYAPLTETEELVLAAERALNSAAFHERFPEAGEDVKVMAVRVARRLELVVAVAFVDRCVPDLGAYFERKRELRDALQEELRARLVTLDELALELNALDVEARGNEGAYLTVLGTSADGADGGEVGRGNRVNGLIPFHRPHSMEAAAGKNPARHVGKIYNLLAQQVAERLHSEVAELEEATVYLASRIGHPVARPWLASAELSLAPGVALADVAERVHVVCEHELAAIPAFLERLAREGLPVC